MNNPKQWFTADEHYGHSKILNFAARPYQNLKIMHKKIIHNHNIQVSPNDEVFHVGDFCMSKSIKFVQSMLRKLNGGHHLVLGNHERLDMYDYLEAGFRTVQYGLKLIPPPMYKEFFEEHYSVSNVYLTHDPVIATNLFPKVVFCGHIHNLFLVFHNAINIGVDVWNYSPVGWDSIVKMLSSYKLLTSSYHKE